MEHWSDTEQLQKATSSKNDVTPAELVEPATESAPSDVSGAGYEMNAVIEDADHEDVSLPPPHYPPLHEFPKEFKKNYLESLDRRYFAILILTLILEPLIIWYMLRTHPLTLSERAVTNLQNRFAQLFLSEFKEEAPATAPLSHELVRRAAESIPRILEGVDAGSPVPTAAVPRFRTGRAKPEAGSLSSENREAVRRLNTISRQLRTKALSEEVERIGLLGVITSGSGVISQAPVTDILAHADSTMGDLASALAQVNELRIPRAGVDYYGTSVGRSLGAERRRGFGNDQLVDQVHIAPKELRGKRATSSGVVPEDIVTGLSAAPQKTIERNQKFERIASAPNLLLSTDGAATEGSGLPGIARLRARPANVQATRDRDRIRDIVLSHNPAIQDCYRHQLKGNAALKGKVTVRFTIDPMGRVVNAEIVHSEMTSDGVPVALAQMEECILNKIRKWRDFGQVDETQGDVTFRQTYNFGY
ncbi:MAG: AgmX/PglI C-terminal domain-containing protein [candidate division KSB1 bacterium]|nr:AgmX/PglI C-terminal domain-containing protein [candidate division KSB1 bacterium]MDZ7365547.1 AgmX/PglI C-terminal domain-containing protein [candidate division KSB1 bacterium]MDZ7403650.1 AgmX/PglI C-terminal domain-containing protein [candidate division KSB1 bacterium]